MTTRPDVGIPRARHCHRVNCIGMHKFASQLPVHSPVTLRSLSAGLGAAFSRSLARRAEGRVRAWLNAQFGEHDLRLLDSGTSALAAAIGGIHSPRPRCVALPAYGCFDLATAVDSTGAAFVLYDIDPGTLAPNLDSLRRALDDGADVVVLAHLYGVPSDITPLAAEMSVRGVRVIDDAAQGVGAAIGGRRLGSLWHRGVLSFGRGKGLTGGVGGALLSASDEVLPESVPGGVGQLGGAGWRGLLVLFAQWVLARPGAYWLPSALPFLHLGETRYRRPHSMQAMSRAAVGVLSQSIMLAEVETSRRIENAERLRRVMVGTVLEPPQLAPLAKPGYLRFPVVATAAIAQSARLASARRLGIMPGYPCSLADLEGFGSRRRNPHEPVAGSRVLAERLITFPTHSRLSEQAFRAIEAWIQTVGCGSRPARTRPTGRSA